MELKVSNFDSLILQIKKDPTLAEDLVKLYGNKRAEAAIEESWNRAIHLFTKARKSRNKKLKDQILKYDEETGFVNMIELIDFFSSLEDEVIEIAQKATHDETRILLEDLVDFMYQKIQGLSIDRRLLFSKRYEEAKREENRTID